MTHPSSDTQRWLKISAHLDRALDLSPVERDAWLKALTTTDPELASELAEMLVDHRQLRSQGFLDESPLRESDAPLSGVIIGAYTLISRIDRKSTRLNSSHSQISYAVFCLKKKKNSQLTNQT